LFGEQPPRDTAPGADASTKVPFEAGDGGSPTDALSTVDAGDANSPLEAGADGQLDASSVDAESHAPLLDFNLCNRAPQQVTGTYTWSPRWLALSAMTTTSSESQLLLLRVDEMKIAAPMLIGSDIYEYSWSADGGFLALRLVGLNSALVDVTSSSVVVRALSARALDWAPSGSRLVTGVYEGYYVVGYAVVDASRPSEVLTAVDIGGAALSERVIWSPDGAYFAFSARALNSLFDNDGLYVAAASGGGGPRYVAGTGALQPNWQEVLWSADGRFLAYQVYEQGSENLYVVDVAQTPLVPRRIETMGSLHGFNAFAWLTSSRLLYQLQSSTVPGGLWLTDVQGGDQPLAIYDSWRNWLVSPNGSQLAHYGPFFAAEPLRLRVQDLAAGAPSAPMPVALGTHQVDSFAWSPSSDGLLVTMFSDVPDGSQQAQLAAIKVSKGLVGSATLVSEGARSMEQQRWSPSSAWVSARVSYSSSERFRLCHLPTLTAHDFHSASPAPSYPYIGAWSPDGRAFVVADIGDKPALTLRFADEGTGLLSDPLVASGVLPHAETTIAWQPCSAAQPVGSRTH
jgi:hypothetical protein